MTLENYKIIKNSDDIVMTNQRVAFSSVLMIFFGQIKKRDKRTCFIMGLFNRKVNYRIKGLFRRIFIRILFSISKNLFF